MACRWILDVPRDIIFFSECIELRVCGNWFWAEELLDVYFSFSSYTLLYVYCHMQECEELMAKGITGTGEGFDLPGRRLGGFSHQPPVSSLRQTALAAAEKRARLGSLLPSGPKRLGGDSTIMDALSPIQAAAMAAERRLQDDIWCGFQSSEAYSSEKQVHREGKMLEVHLRTGNCQFLSPLVVI